MIQIKIIEFLLLNKSFKFIKCPVTKKVNNENTTRY